MDKAEPSGARRWSFECLRKDHDTNESHDWKKSCKPESDQEFKLVLSLLLFMYGQSMPAGRISLTKISLCCTKLKVPPNEAVVRA